MKTVSEIVSALSAPFPPEQVSFRVGATNKRNFDAKKVDKRKGRILSFLDARDVMRRLNEVCGPQNWQNRYVPMPNGTACCEIGIRLDGEWVWKANGADMLPDRDTADAREMAAKGAYSDGFKRAAVLWGVGQYLYDADAPWIELNDDWEIPDTALPKLRAILGKAGNAPSAAPPVSSIPGRTSPMSNPHYKIAFEKLSACESLDELGSIWRQLQPNIREWSPELKKAIEDKKNSMKEALGIQHKEAAE